MFAQLVEKPVEFEHQLRLQVQRPIRFRVWLRLRDRVGRQVWFRVWQKVTGQVRDQLWDEVRLCNKEE